MHLLYIPYLSFLVSGAMESAHSLTKRLATSYTIDVKDQLVEIAGILYMICNVILQCIHVCILIYCICVYISHCR